MMKIPDAISHKYDIPSFDLDSVREVRGTCHGGDYCDMQDVEQPSFSEKASNDHKITNRFSRFHA